MTRWQTETRRIPPRGARGPHQRLHGRYSCGCAAVVWIPRDAPFSVRKELLAKLRTAPCVTCAERARQAALTPEAARAAVRARLDRDFPLD